MALERIKQNYTFQASTTVYGYHLGNFTLALKCRMVLTYES